MSPRPRLRPSARPLRRRDGALQFGLSPHAGLIVEGLSRSEVALVRLLDGSRELTELYAAASEAGIGAGRVTQLVDGLRRRGLLVEDPPDGTPTPEPGAGPLPRGRQRRAAEALSVAYGSPGDGWGVLERRRRAHVLVTGEGLVPEVLAAGLAAAGVGSVTVGREAVTAWLDRVTERRARPAELVGLPDLVVLAALDVLPLGEDLPWAGAGVAQLPVVVQDPRVLVGPLLDPRSGPCLRCLDLHRSDRDAGWPAVFAQIGCADPTARPAPVDTDAALAQLAAGHASALVGMHLDGQTDPTGVSVETAIPWGQTVHRVWDAHPRCTAHRPDALAAATNRTQ